MLKIFILFGLMAPFSLIMSQSPLLEADREAILSMEGCHTLIFDFAEIFPADTIGSKPYHAEGVEYVKVIQNDPDHISLQHLLVINDTMVIKHWRQDWILNAEKELNYSADSWWTQEKPPMGERMWTQKVYQVDDGPRYSGTGQWVHAAGRSYWQGEGDAPLPRREFSKRDDYNVVDIAAVILSSRIKVGCLNRTIKRSFGRGKPMKSSPTKKDMKNSSKETKRTVGQLWIIGTLITLIGVTSARNGNECIKIIPNLK